MTPRGRRAKKDATLTARQATAHPAPSYDAPGIARLRGRLHLSQPVFANVLNVSPETVRAWEQGRTTPSGPALRLLQVAEEHPSVILASLRPRER